MEALTKKRKIYIAALAIAGVAWIVDRGIATPSAAGPATAEASIAVPAAERDATPVAFDATPPCDAGTVSVSQQLSSLAQASGVDATPGVDVFRPSADWLADAVTAAKPPAESLDTARPEKLFAEQHHLTGVMVADQQHLIIVNGKALRIGQVIDGFRLVEIGDRSAVFENDAQVRVTLPMSEPAPHAASRRAR